MSDGRNNLWKMEATGGVFCHCRWDLYWDTLPFRGSVSFFDSACAAEDVLPSGCVDAETSEDWAGDGRAFISYYFDGNNRDWIVDACEAAV